MSIFQAIDNQHGSGRMRRVGAVLTVVVLFAVMSHSAVARMHRAPRSGFCTRSFVPDYLAQTAQMVPINRVPAHGRLPFGPSDLVLQALGTRLMNPGALGRVRTLFAFSLADPAAQERPIQLNWTVKTRISSVDQQGNVVKEVESGETSLGEEVPFLEHLFGIKANLAVGFYRFDLGLVTEPEAPPHWFSEYLRVMRPVARTRLVLDGARHRAGSVLRYRLANPGTAPVFVSSEVQLQRRRGGHWITVPPEKSGVIDVPPLSLEGLEPATQTRCLRMTLPKKQPAGKYRIVQRVRPDLGKHRAPPRKVIAAFWLTH